MAPHLLRLQFAGMPRGTKKPASELLKPVVVYCRIPDRLGVTAEIKIRGLELRWGLPDWRPVGLVGLEPTIPSRESVVPAPGARVAPGAVLVKGAMTFPIAQGHDVVAKIQLNSGEL
jgi:hypothetical protein